MSDPVNVNTVELAPVRGGKPLLVVAPSLGTSASALWAEVARRLGDAFGVLGMDLPGHGVSKNVAPLRDMPTLARAVLAAVDAAAGKGTAFFYAGVSVSGCIGLQLLLDAPDRIRGAAIINSAAKIGEHAGWMERAAFVRASGTKAMVASSAGRWFGPGFMDRNPDEARTLLDSLAATDAEGYAGVCEALASFDVRDKLAAISRPVIAIGGENDPATPPEFQKALVRAIKGARLEVIPGVGHLAPGENPEAVAGFLADFFKG